MKRGSEASLYRPIIDLLAVHGIWAWRQNQGTMHVGKRWVRFCAVKGISDIIGITDTGRFVAIEVKTPKGKASVEQQAFIDSIRERGGIAGIVTTLDEVAELLRDK